MHQSFGRCSHTQLGLVLCALVRFDMGGIFFCLFVPKCVFCEEGCMGVRNMVIKCVILV